MGVFARTIKERRKRLGMTQKELAEMVGVSQVAIHQYEKGEATPKLAIAMRLAAALKTSCEYLATGRSEQ
jgi:transcriptional regulator with XRE-family HTH domain